MQTILYSNIDRLINIDQFCVCYGTFYGANIIKYGVKDPLAEENQATLIPIEKAKGHLLFVASEDDLNWDSKAYMDQMVERL